MKRTVFAAAVALSLGTTPTIAQDAPFGTEADMAYAAVL